MTNIIPNVPRELLEELRDAANEGMNAATRQHQIDYFAGLIAKADALLSAPSPAGVGGLEVIGWYTDDHLNDKSATTYSKEVADRWLAKGWPVTGIANSSEAQAIIDGLRGEVESRVEAALSTDRAVRHQQAQRIGELEGLLRISSELLTTISAHAGTKPNDWCDTFKREVHDRIDRIDAALSAGKEGE